MTWMTWLLLILFLTPPDTSAQSPFERSAIGVQFNTTASEAMLNNYWNPGAGGSITWTTPFYLGEMEIEAGFLPMQASQPEIPDIMNILTTLGWLLPLDITDRLTLSAGLRIGNNFMYRRAKGPLDMPESEFVAGLTSSLQFRITEALSVRAGIHQNRVFTYHRINLTTAVLGLQYHFNTPGSLVRFLQ